MSAAPSTSITEQTYWIDGLPFSGIKHQPANTSEVKYWIDGLPVESIFPPTNADTGKFFLLFE